MPICFEWDVIEGIKYKVSNAWTKETFMRRHLSKAVERLNSLLVFQ